MTERGGRWQNAVFASNNAGKLAEVRKILAEFGMTVVPQSEFAVPAVAEDGATFAENALIKARHAALATGLPAIADDSGLIAQALGGAPGVHSARYAGDGATDAQNIDKLLQQLAGVQGALRAAAFHCAAVLLPPEGEPLLAQGSWHGLIAHARHGSAGFGYDPVFLDPELGRTAAQMSSTEKNARSHRGRAFRQLAEKMRALPRPGT